MSTRRALSFEPKLPRSPPESKAESTVKSTPHPRPKSKPKAESTLVVTGVSGDICFSRHIVGTSAHNPPSGQNGWLGYANSHLQEYGVTQALCPCISHTGGLVDKPHRLADISVGAHVVVVLPSGEVFIGVTPTCGACNTAKAAFSSPFTLVTIASLRFGTFVGTLNPNTAQSGVTKKSTPGLKKIHAIEVRDDRVTAGLTNLTLSATTKDAVDRTMPHGIADNDDYMLQLAVLSRNRLRRLRAVADAKFVEHVPVVVHVSPLENTYAVLERNSPGAAAQ